MLRTYQSIYVPLYRWTFKNFGQRRAPHAKFLFNVSFLLIIMLTAALLAIDILLHSGIITANLITHTAILFGMVALLFINHLILLNNRLLRKVDAHFAIISRHNRNLLALVVLVHVIIICGFLIFTVR